MGAPYSSTSSESHAGAVYAFNLDEVLAGGQPEPVAVVEGSVQNGRLKRMTISFKDFLICEIIMLGSGVV